MSWTFERYVQTQNTTSPTTSWSPSVEVGVGINVDVCGVTDVTGRERAANVNTTINVTASLNTPLPLSLPLSLPLVVAIVIVVSHTIHCHPRQHVGLELDHRDGCVTDDFYGLGGYPLFL